MRAGLIESKVGRARLMKSTLQRHSRSLLGLSKPLPDLSSQGILFLTNVALYRYQSRAETLGCSLRISRVLCTARQKHDPAEGKQCRRRFWDSRYGDRIQMIAVAVGGAGSRESDLGGRVRSR